MRAVIQRVLKASVSIDGEMTASCGPGLLIFLGVGKEDAEAEAERLWSKIAKLRIFPDGDKPTGRSVLEREEGVGDVLVISQFTLYADCRKGNRPSFTAAGDPARSEELYEHFISCARKDSPNVSHGTFGADMQVELTNDGPFTICLDTDELQKPRKA